SLLCHCVSHIRIHSLCRPVSEGKCFDLGNISPDRGKLQPTHQIQSSICAQSACSRPDRIEKDRMSQLVRLPSRPEHSLNACLMQCSDIDIQPAAHRCNILHIFCLV